MNIFTNGNKIEMLTQQVNDLTERIEKLEYILRRYPPPYNPYLNSPSQEQPTYLAPNLASPNMVPPNNFPSSDNRWTNQ
jgi:hypothetical protein